MTSDPLPPVQIVPLGDSALTVVLGDQVSLDVNRRVHALTRRVGAERVPGVTEIVPAYSSLAVFYDALATDARSVTERLREIAGRADTADDATQPTEHVLPVTYDGEDLDHVAHTCGLSPDDVIALHAHTPYSVFFLGFVPGFAYLGTLPPALVLPRRAVPRRAVPAGAVAIAGQQTAVYPLATPGGWHLIGHTAAELWNPERRPPALLAPGDVVRFEPR